MRSTGMGFRGIKVVYLKEFKDSVRDRRALLTALMPAILAPMFMIFMFNSIADTRDSSESLEVQVIGQHNAPDLIDYLSQRDISFSEYDGDPKQDIQASNIEVVLEIPNDFADSFTSSEPASVFIHSDNSIDRSNAASDRLRGLIQGYGSSIGSMRLLVRGINPAITSAVVVQDRDYSTDTSRAARILSAMQMFILMAAFFGSAPAAIDTTAGERERNSLEPLLVHPVSSWQLVLGKYLSVCSFGLLASVTTVLVTGFALESVSLEALGVDPRLSLPMQIYVIGILIPIVLFAAALQMLSSLFAKSFKEAQSYTGLITILPILVVVPSFTGATSDADWMFAVPLLGQKQLVDQVLRGEMVDWLNLMLASGVTVLVTALLLTVLMRILRSERVVYGS